MIAGSFGSVSRHSRPQTVWLVLAILPLSACVTTDDPSKGGAIDGAAGILTGSYERRLEEKRARLAESERRRDELMEEQRAVDLETRELEQEAKLAQARLEALSLEVDQLSVSLSDALAAETITTQAYEQLSREVEELQHDAALADRDAPMSEEARQEILVALQDRRDSLASAIDKAMTEALFQ